MTAPIEIPESWGIGASTILPDSRCGIEIVSSNGRDVATVWTVEVSGFDDDEERERVASKLQMERVRLIAAAQELLVVARDADRIERLLSERSENCARINGAGRNTLGSVLAAKRRLQEIEVELREIRFRRDHAIAKAEGRS